MDEVIDRTKEIVLTCKRGRTPLCFQLTCDNPGVPHEKVKAVTHTSRVYGALEANEQTLLEIPEIETFDEFLKQKLGNNVEGYTFE